MNKNIMCVITSFTLIKGFRDTINFNISELISEKEI
jgi:hypothetical protein